MKDRKPEIFGGPTPQPPVKPFDLISAIIRYESDGMTEDETIELFQHLVDTGMAWQLQGHYGRTAQALIEQGLVKPPQPKEKEQNESEH